MMIKCKKWNLDSCVVEDAGGGEEQDKPDPEIAFLCSGGHDERLAYETRE